MVDAWLPYGKTELCARIPARNYLGIIDPKERKSVADGKAEVERSLGEPIGKSRLRELARPENRVAIVVDDATRPTPTEIMIHPILRELNDAGVKDENVTIIFACGIHRPMIREEAVKVLGEEIVNRIKMVSHDCRAKDLVDIGTTKLYGNRILLNRFFVQADLKILTGDVSFHYYAGYGGGRKSILPGIAGEESIKRNHAMLLNTNASTGVLEGNPVHEDMVEAATLAKVDFALNVVTNSRGEIVKAFAGDVEQIFAEGVRLVDEMYRVTIDRRADIVVVSAGGYPADLNLYQAHKAVDNVSDVVKRGGVIVLVAECPEGHGNQAFYDWMVKYPDTKTIEREIKRNFVLGGHKAYFLLDALQHAKIILVSSMPDYYAAGVFRMKTAKGINEAISMAFDIAGSSAKVWTVPHGNLTFPEFKPSELTNHSVDETAKVIN